MGSRSSTGSGSASKQSTGTRERILDVAREKFLNDGYAKTSINSITTELGISGPALYWHFTSKEEILYELIRERLQIFLDELVTNASTPVNRLADLVRTWTGIQLSTDRDARGYAHLMAITKSGRILTAEHVDELANMQREVYQRIRETIQSGVDAGEFTVPDVPATTFAIITMSDEVISWARPDGRLDPESIADIFVQLVLRMVGHGGN